MHDLLGNIAFCIITAAAFAFIAKAVRQPLTLAYLLAGVIIGPIGLKLVEDKESIETISEIGLILLLYVIGLEIDLKKLLAAGKPVIVGGISQFLICSAIGMAFFALPAFSMGGKFALAYLAVTTALSSTMVVVKLLYDKFELDTLPGRITIGILVFQDLWAILLLALQPNLLNPKLTVLALSAFKGLLLVVLSLAISKYVLPALFRWIAKLPEVVLIASLAWCFLVSGAASYAGLSREMGALIAGVSVSTFPYNLDVIAKVISIRDFFVTLFFVALGMKIPVPDGRTIGLAAAASIFLIASRFLSVFPVLYALKLGHRASLLPSINLAQMSEFSLVIASIGLSYKHVGEDVVSLLIFIFVITCVCSTYMITYNHELQDLLSRFLKRIGFADIGEVSEAEAAVEAETKKKIVLLGFFREASSLLHEFELAPGADGRHPLLDEVLVIDFNPQVYAELKRRGIACLYGDVAHMDTLHHAEISGAELVISTIPDSILKGTDNYRLMKQVRRLCPKAKVIVTTESISKALEFYEEGADYVFIPRLHSAQHMAHVVEHGLHHGFETLREEQIELLRKRNEVLP